MPIDDVPLQPDTQMFAALSRILDDMLVEHAPGGSVVLVLARPGSGALTASDLAWNSALRTHLSARVRRIFVAVSGEVRPITLDDAA